MKKDLQKTANQRKKKNFRKLHETFSVHYEEEFRAERSSENYYFLGVKMKLYYKKWKSTDNTAPLVHWQCTKGNKKLIKTA